MPENWEHYLDVLVRSSTEVLDRFFQRHPEKTLIAVGYVFELWNVSPQFDLCAHIGKQADAQPEVRWNSGDYEFPAGLLNKVDELGPEWTQIIDHLHGLAEEQEDEGTEGEVYSGLIDISCRAIVCLARSGLFSDPLRLDYNIAEVSDPVETVADRNKTIHDQLRTKASPFSGANGEQAHRRSL